jgi:hypothetical protein
LIHLKITLTHNTLWSEVIGVVVTVEDY